MTTCCVFPALEKTDHGFSSQTTRSADRGPEPCAGTVYKRTSATRRRWTWDGKKMFHHRIKLKRTNNCARAAHRSVCVLHAVVSAFPAHHTTTYQRTTHQETLGRFRYLLLAENSANAFAKPRIWTWVCVCAEVEIAKLLLYRGLCGSECVCRLLIEMRSLQFLGNLLPSTLRLRYINIMNR